MKPPLKILIVEHNAFDLELIDHELREDGMIYVSHVVENESEYIYALSDFLPDIILSDYAFPSFDGATAFTIRQDMAPTVPFIFVTGTIGEEVAVSFIKNGVTDYVLKDKLFTIVPKIKRAMVEVSISHQKKLSEELREFDSNNMNALINSTNDLMWSVDKNFNLIASNIPFDEIGKINFGKPIAKGESVLSATHSPEMFTNFKRLYERAFAGEIFTETEYFEIPVESWSEISYYPIRNADLIVGAACHSRDISKIKIAERLIISNQTRFRALVENGADAVVILSAEAKPFYVSPTVEIVLGYTETETQHLDLSAMIHPEDIASAIIVWERTIISPGVPISLNPLRMKHKDGSWRWLEGTLTNLLHDPAINGIVDNFRDVTQRKEAKDALLLTQFAVDNAADAVFWMTSAARIVNVNEAACAMLGYTRNELIKLSVPDIDPKYDSKRWNNHYAELREKGALFFETMQKAKDGRSIPVEIRANYINFGDTELNCAIVRDVTERKKAEKERENLTNALIHRNRDLEQFTFIISHNLRAPIANIIGFTKNLLYEDLTPEEQSEFLNGLSDSVLQMDTTIKDINSILQVKLDLNERKEPISFSKLVSDILVNTGKHTDKFQVRINHDFSEVMKSFRSEST